MYALGIVLFLFAVLPASAQADLWKTEPDNTPVRVVRRFVAHQETGTVSECALGVVVFLMDRPVRITAPERRDGTRAWHQPEDPLLPKVIGLGPDREILRIELKSGEGKQ
jgi:hypothetical protein